jgi:short-subunit dehydrogenase
VSAAATESNKGWAIVTGASSGIGRVFAQELAARQYPVLAVARREERLQQLARDVTARGGRLEALAADLQTSEGVAAVARRAGELGDVELLINNAGIATAGDFISSSLEAELGEIQLNVGTVVALTHRFLPAMVQRGRGGVLNLSSAVGFQPFPHFAVYAATKAFVLSFTEALAEEVRGTGVRVLAICPGSVRSELDVFARNEGLLGKLPSLSPEEVVATALHALQKGRIVTVVGIMNQALVFSNRLAPRWLMRKAMGTIARPPIAKAPPRDP